MPNGLVWLYYQFCSEYARKPDDIDDMCDGLLCMWAKGEIEKIYAEKD